MSSVYFIECADRIKIGVSRDVAERLKSLQTGAPAPLTLLATVPGTRHLERAIHKTLKPYRIVGEWFRDCDDVRQVMSALIERGPAAINFVEPVRDEELLAEIRTSSVNHGNPYIPINRRIETCIDRYLGEIVMDAREAEKRSGLRRGELVDKIIPGHFSDERARFAFSMVKNTIDRVDRLIGGVISICAGNRSISESDAVAEGFYYVSQLESGLDTLFRSPDLSVVDVSGYEGMGAR